MSIVQNAHCDLCDYNYLANEPDDRRQHNKRHKLAVAALEKYGPDVILGYDAREALKHQGHELLRSTSDLKKRVDGALMVLRSWYSRSLGATFHPKHPTFSEYVATLVRQDPNCWSPDVMDELRRSFPNASKFNLNGSYWVPPQARTNRN